jgi:chromosome segregation ATPase
MNIIALLGILSVTHGTDEEFALSLVRAAQHSSYKSLEDAFTVALGAGRLEPQTAHKLISALERLGATSNPHEYDPESEPELAGLRDELNELIGRQQRLRNEQELISHLQEEVRKMQDQCAEAKARRCRLNDGINEMQEQLDRIDRIERETQL